MSKKIFKIDKEFNNILQDIGNYNPENKIPVSKEHKRVNTEEQTTNMDDNILSDSENEISKGQFLFYETDDGITKIDVRMHEETVWLSNGQMVELFNSSKSNISEHISNIFSEGELNESSTVRDFRTVQIEGGRKTSRTIPYYNLDVIISVGYRVKSLRGTQFRIWATERLREYIIKGFTMNDDMLKKGGISTYFEELLERIRDIRSSEKMFYSKVLDIFKTSSDYNRKSNICEEFFKVVQNKFHYGSHGHTASEIIFDRVDASNSNMGLTNWVGNITKEQIHIAKNYLLADELDRLNRLVTIYLDFAELQAKSYKALRMEDHVNKIDDILRMTDSKVLRHSGSISHKRAVDKANKEYEKFKKQQKEMSRVEKDMIKSLEKQAKLIEKQNKKKKP